MKLSDPFGRMERKHQVGYEAMRDAMRRGGINTPEAAQEVLRQSRRRSLKFLGVALVLLLLVSWMLPQALPVAFVLTLLLVLWLASWTINGRRYIRRYIDEDLK